MIFDDFLIPKRKLMDGSEPNLIWYCLSAASKRFTATDIDIISGMRREGYLVAVVLTKIDEISEKQLLDFRTDLNSAFEEKKVADCPVFNTSILARSNESIAEFCEWDELIEWSVDNLDEAYKSLFTSSLSLENDRKTALVALEQKRVSANGAIPVAIAASSAAALSPIPFSDAALIAPIQIAMIQKIVRTYCQENAAAINFSRLVSGVLATTIGKSIVGTIVKFIPGVGSLVGGVINATVAGGITAALGYTLSGMLYDTQKKKINGEKMNLDIEQLFASDEFIGSITANFKNKKYE